MVAAIGAGIGVTLAIATAFAVGWQRPDQVSCEAGAALRAGGVWDSARKDSLRVAFSSSRLPNSDDTWARVESRLDDYVRRWIEMHAEACRATRVEARQSDLLMDLRIACLERRRAALGALTDVWASGVDAETLAAAVEAAGALPPLAECADVRALTERAPLPRDPARVAQIAAARAQVDVARALELAHRLPAARRVAAGARAMADATGWAQARAEAAFVEGDILDGLRDPAGQAPLIEAARLAGEARDDRLAARALIVLIRTLAQDEQSSGRALLVADVAEGVVARTADEVLGGRLLTYRGEALFTGGRYEAARAVLVAARARLTIALGPGAGETLVVIAALAKLAGAMGIQDEALRLGEEGLARTIALKGAEHPSVAAILNNLAITADAAGDRAAAAAYYRRTLALREQITGADSASTAIALSNFAGFELEAGHLDEAETLLLRALTIRERVLAPEHPYLANTLGNLAMVRRQQGRFAEALELDRRALAIKTKAYGPAHEDVANTLADIGSIHAAEGNYAEALPFFRQALDVRMKALGAGHEQTLYSMNLVAEALQHLARCVEARPLIATTVAALEKMGGVGAVSLAEALAIQARCDLADGQAGRAIPALERAVALLERAQENPIGRGSARWALAQALWAVGRRAPAIAAARLAEQELATSADGAHSLATARAWLALRTRPSR